MSTYNGRKYLSEQIESILNQKIDSDEYTLDLYIRDDGSCDETESIVTTYMTRSENIHLLQNSGTNLGVQGSFYSLMRCVEADYYFFCDQDDVWFYNKVTTFMNEFKKHCDKIPCGVYSDLSLIDTEGKALGKTMMQEQGWSYDEKRDLSLLMFNTRVTGAAFAINRAARDEVIRIDARKFSSVLMHDSIIALLTQVYDNLYFIPKTLVGYRQHENNVLGAAPQKHSQFEIGFKKNHYRHLFHDLMLVIQVLNWTNVPNTNMTMIRATQDFVKQQSFRGRVASIFKNYKCLWDKFRLRHVVFLLVFYRYANLSKIQ